MVDMNTVTMCFAHQKIPDSIPESLVDGLEDAGVEKELSLPETLEISCQSE